MGAAAITRLVKIKGTVIYRHNVDVVVLFLVRVTLTTMITLMVPCRVVMVMIEALMIVWIIEMILQHRYGRRT